MNSLTSLVHRTLACHPRTPDRVIRAVGVAAGGTADGGLALSFALEGDLTAVRIPEHRPSRRVDGLWRHTCFEAFVMAGEGPGYREFNFSPSGEWAITAFRGYRDAAEQATESGPEIKVRRRGERLELDAEIRPECLPPGRSLRLGLSAVVEDAHGELTYWALRHPEGQPDFHHKDAFALPLELTSMADVDTLTGRMVR
ncbi:MAG: DOMON-like domain-containing protein [Gammaproteobacteria bacterium]